MTRLVLLLMLALAGCGVFKGKKKTPSVGERISVLSINPETEADPALADVLVVIPPEQPNADYAQPGGIPSKDLDNLALAAAPTRIWTANIEGSSSTRRLSAAPVVAGGRVFVIDTVGRVYAFALDTGQEVWRREIVLKGQGDRAAFGGGVSVGSGRVYAATGFGIIQAFDATDGKPLWRRELGGPLRGSPAIDETNVYVESQDNQLFALNPATGETVWSVAATVEQAGLLGAGTPAIAGSTVVAGYSSGELVAYLAANGRTVWQDALSRTGRSTAIAALSDIDASPVIDRDRVFAIGHGGRMVAVELTTGQRVWERNFAGVSMPWVAGEWVFATTVQAELVAVSRGDGRVRWVTQLQNYRNMRKKKGEIRWYGPLMASGRLWMTASSGQIAWADPATGKVTEAGKVDDPVYLPPVIASSTLLVLNDKGRLTAFK